MRQRVIFPSLEAMSSVNEWVFHGGPVILADFTPIPPSRIINLEGSHLKILHYDLSDHFQARAFEKKLIDRSTGEAAALAKWEDGACFPSASFDLFLQELGDLNHRLTGGLSERRRTAMGTTPDRAGVKIAFPSTGETALQLRWLWQRLSDSETERLPAILLAASALVVLTNSHLFTDGNGRLSRAIFNYVLHSAGMPRNVIPLSGIAIRYDYGFDTHAVLRSCSYSFRMETKKSFKPMKAGPSFSPDT